MPIPTNELSAPFDPRLIKRRKGNFGKQIAYAESSTVVKRLNEVLDGQWSFCILGYSVENEDEVIVHGELRIADEVRQQFGGSILTKTKDGDRIVSLSDDLKAAASDCLKKCATSFGVGLYLYCDPLTNKPNDQRPKAQQTPASTNGNGHLSQEMIAGLISQAKNAGFSQVELIKRAKNLFDKTLGQLTVVEAQQVVKELKGRINAQA